MECCSIIWCKICGQKILNSFIEITQLDLNSFVSSDDEDDSLLGSISSRSYSDEDEREETRDEEEEETSYHSNESLVKRRNKERDNENSSTSTILVRSANDMLLNSRNMQFPNNYDQFTPEHRNSLMVQVDTSSATYLPRPYGKLMKTNASTTPTSAVSSVSNHNSKYSVNHKIEEPKKIYFLEKSRKTVFSIDEQSQKPVLLSQIYRIQRTSGQKYDGNSYNSNRSINTLDYDDLHKLSELDNSHSIHQHQNNKLSYSRLSTMKHQISLNERIRNSLDESGSSTKRRRKTSIYD